MATPRPEIKYQRLGETPREEEEGEVTIYLSRQPPSSILQARYREFCFRIFSSILLLLVASGFVLYDLEFRSGEASAAPQGFLVESANISGGSPSLTKQEELEEHHHHHHFQTSDHEEEDQHEEVSSPHHHSEGTYHQAAAVTDSETCSALARDVLQSGGSVVDAGISAALCLVVVHPHTSSLGGVFSSILFLAGSQNASVLNSVPSEAPPTSFGVPQVLQGLRLLHLKFGKTPWAQLVSPAIILAERGYLVDPSLHAALLANQHKVLSSEGLRSLFSDPHQRLKEVGERVENPALGKVLEKVGSSMSDAVLPEDLLHSLIHDIGVTDPEEFSKSASRQLTMEDPLTLHLDRLTLLTTGGPTAGHILYNVIQKVAGDHNVESIPERLLNSSKMAYTSGGAWPRDLPAVRPPSWNPTAVGSNVMVANTHGDIFVLSLTLNSSFGSGFVSSSTGILLSDFVQGHDLQNSAPLYWACPSVVIYGEDSDVMGLSASGGSSVPFSLARVIVSHLLLEVDLTEAVSDPLVEEEPPDGSDPWLEFFGLRGNSTGSVVAVEVESEHVHVVKSPGPCCYTSGL